VDDFIRETSELAQVQSPWDKRSRFLRDKHNRELSEWYAVAERFRSASRWEIEEGVLPKGIGRYRLSVLFFELPGGRSRLFLDFDPGTGIARPIHILNALALAPPAELQSSFQGMKVYYLLNSQQWRTSWFGAIDWESPYAGQITVDRRSFSLTQEAFEALEWLKSRGGQFQAKVLSESPSIYSERICLPSPRHGE
jgi:hypothetical protein